jgi:hypothetical protein
MAIGISAVVAALQYASGCKTDSTKTDAHVSQQQIKWLADLAA